MPNLTITVTVDDEHTVHVCGSDCDCPRALALTQEAIDADRAERGAQPRTLSERLHGMRHAAPSTHWFELAAVDAKALEARATTAGGQAAAWAEACDASDAASPSERAASLHAVVAETFRLLERAELLPFQREHVYDPKMEITRVYAGTKVFAAELTGSLDTPAAHYAITTSDETDPDDASERFTTDIHAVSAWLLAWACAPRH